jgi:hypothetical protein
MVSPRLALPRLRRRLKGKNGVNRHTSLYRLKNYGIEEIKVLKQAGIF